MQAIARVNRVFGEKESGLTEANMINCDAGQAWDFLISEPVRRVRLEPGSSCFCVKNIAVIIADHVEIAEAI